MNRDLISEWDPILTPILTEYGWVRLNGDVLELKLARHPELTIKLDAKCIPQLITILSKLDANVFDV